MTGSIHLAGGQTIQKGEYITLAKVDSELAQRLAAFYLVQKDFEFAIDCLREALENGIPDAHNLPSRAFIYSGVVAYARPFMSDVRQLKLAPDTFVEINPAFDLTIHQFLMDVRSKHIAHSVNEFDYCRAVASMVGSNETSWRPGGGVSIADTRVIGLSGALVDQAIVHIDAMLSFLSTQVDTLNAQVYEAFAAQFSKDGKWEMAPAGHLPNRQRAGKRRLDD